MPLPPKRIFSLGCVTGYFSGTGGLAGSVPSSAVVEAQGLGLPFGTLARLAQDEKLGCTGREAGGGGGLGK
jgi:hypothetical protein